jgi:uncharacterized protein YaeQ
MAQNATIHKATLGVSDVDRGYYAEHALTIARHPSETDERMMVRVLAFALNAHERLAFGRGLSEAEEPDLWERDATGAIAHWIEIGQPDERAMLRAAGRAARVSVYAYRSGAEKWWAPIATALDRAKNLAVWRIPNDASRRLAALCARTMTLLCTIQDGAVWLGDGVETFEVVPERFKSA